jgi:hypothetical protein
MNQFDEPDEMTERYVCCFCEILVTIKDISVEDEIIDKVCGGE